MYKKTFAIAVILSLIFPSTALGLTLLDRLKARKELYGIMALEADGNGQTYFIHFATGKKYFTGQVDKETGQAFADNKAWIGMTGADLASIPTGAMVPIDPPAMGEIPSSYELGAHPVDQGVYGFCVAMAITRATEEAYYRATGKRIEFSEPQLFAEVNDGGVGLIPRLAREHVKNTGLIEAKYHPFDETPWIEDEGWEEQIKIDALEAKNATRYRFEPHTVIGRYVGSENQIQAIKEAILEYGHLETSIDTIKDWQHGAIYPEDKEFSYDHNIIISGWNEDGWVVHNSYGPKDNRGIMDYAYPMLWITGYTYAGE